MNKWFDSLPEPIRFLTFFVPAATLIVVIVGAPVPYSGIALFLLMVLAVGRIGYILLSRRGQ